MTETYDNDTYDATDDAAAADMDGGGVPDTMAVDLDADGISDAVALDSDLDGQADMLLVDTNGDQMADVAYTDPGIALGSPDEGPQQPTWDDVVAPPVTYQDPFANVEPRYDYQQSEDYQEAMAAAEELDDTGWESFMAGERLESTTPKA